MVIIKLAGTFILAEVDDGLDICVGLVVFLFEAGSVENLAVLGVTGFGLESPGEGFFLNQEVATIALDGREGRGAEGGGGLEFGEEAASGIKSDGANGGGHEEVVEGEGREVGAPHVGVECEEVGRDGDDGKEKEVPGECFDKLEVDGESYPELVHD